MNDDQKIEERKIFHRVRRLLTAHDPMYLAFHNVKFEAPLSADPANGILGGWTACMRLEWVVGFARVYVKTNGRFKIVLGSMPKNAEGKNEWKTLISHDDVEEASIIPTFWKYDNINNPIAVPGAMTTADTKKRRRKK